MRSAVPLPCFFDVVKSHRVAGQRPRQGTKSCRMGRNSVRPSVRPSARPSIRPPPAGLQGLKGQPAGSEGQPAGSEGQPAGSEGQPEGGGRTDGRADGRTEFLPILQDFVPCRGRCPATLCDFTTSKKQGTGTADFMMPFGFLFIFSLILI